MIRRICPICDQVMSLPHYCTTCRSFVKEPWVRDVDYYLNESHPADEENCSYHHMTPGELPVESPWEGAFEALGRPAHTAGGTTGSLRGKRKQAVPNVPADPSLFGRHSSASAVPNVPRGEQRKKEKRSTGKVLLFIIILYILAQIFTAFSNVIFPLFLDASARVQTEICQVCVTEKGSAGMYGGQDAGV